MSTPSGPDQGGWSAPPGRRRPGIVVLALIVVGSLACLVIVGAVAVNLLGSSQSGVAAAEPNTAACEGAFLLRTALVQSLTVDLQQHDQTAFVALASTPAARTTMSLWWHNVTAIGFTTGGVELETDPQADPSSFQQVKVKIGLHHPLDSVTAKPDAPATEYQLRTGALRSASGCHLAIQEWTSLSHAPWDAAQKLYVVKTPHSVVVGEAATKAAVNRAAPLADHAYAWLAGFFAANHHAGYVHQRGYIVFVAATGTQLESWFRGPAAKQPMGWAADPGNVGGLSFPLTGVTLLPAESAAGQATISPLSAGVGGPRVALSPTASRGSIADEQALLVHEFTHAVFSDDDLGLYLDRPPVPAATTEGAARLIEDIYRAQPAGFNGRPFQLIRPQLEAGSASFKGEVPTDQQIYGAAARADYYYDLAASTFDYEISKSGLPFVLQCIELAYANGTGPFGGIITKRTGATMILASPGKETSAWAAWLPQAIAAS